MTDLCPGFHPWSASRVLSAVSCHVAPAVLTHPVLPWVHLSPIDQRLHPHDSPMHDALDNLQIRKNYIKWANEHLCLSGFIFFIFNKAAFLSMVCPVYHSWTLTVCSVLSAFKIKGRSVRVESAEPHLALTIGVSSSITFLPEHTQIPLLHHDDKYDDEDEDNDKDYGDNNDKSRWTAGGTPHIL